MSTALITGASQGFGRALAVDLAKEGWNLVIDGRRAPLLFETSKFLSSLGVEVCAVAGDVADEAHRTELVNSAVSLGGLDLLVNNASELGPSPLMTLDQYRLGDLRRVYDVNVFAALALVQRALPMLRRARGAIVSMSSDAAVEPYERWGGYGSSKAAIDQLHHVLGAEEPALRVYAFDPGDMRTDMHQRATPGEDISDLPEPEEIVPALRRLLAAGPPNGRYRASDWMTS